jgi:hypothetical protein
MIIKDKDLQNVKSATEVEDKKTRKKCSSLFKKITQRSPYNIAVMATLLIAMNVIQAHK